MSGFRFHVGNRGEVKVVVFDDGGCRPASDAEVEMWDALGALRAENEQFREQARHVLPRAAMLSAVHGALIDAGCTVGELGRCEAKLVRELAARAEVAEGAWNTADAERTRLTAEVERLRGVVETARVVFEIADSTDLHNRYLDEAVSRLGDALAATLSPGR